VFLFTQYFRGLPKELEEAAYVDGCGFIRKFIRIVLPLAQSIFIVIIVHSYLAGLFLDGRTVAVQLNRLIATFSANIGHAYGMMQMRGGLAAGSLLMITPMLVLYIFLQRYFTESIERAGIVG
jgi:multiple sugar transport system permease protein